MINLGTIMMAANKNMPAILTGISIASGIASVIECARATAKAVKVLEEMHYKSETEPATIDKVKAVSPLYIRTLILLAIACGAEIGALADSNKKLLAMATVASSNEKELEKLEGKMREKLGDKKVKEIKKEIIKDDILENPPREDGFYKTGTGTVKFRDGTMGGDFLADIEAVKHAFNVIDHTLANGNIACVNDLMHELGRQQSDVGNNLVWMPGDSLCVELMQQDYIPTDLYDMTEEDLKEIIWVVTYAKPHEISDEHIG